MEKRLPIALFLSFLVLFAYQIFFRPAPEEIPPAPAAAPGQGPDPAPAETAAVTAQPGPELPAPDLSATEEETVELVVGSPSGAGAIEPGYYRAVFSNRGARLVSLEFGDYFRRIGLTPEEREDSANWLPLLEAVETAAGPTGSLLLRTSTSSEELAPGGLDNVLWTMQELQGDEPGVEFRYGPGTGVVFTKRITFVPDTWHVRVRLTIENTDAGPGGRREFALVPAGIVPPELEDKFFLEPRATAAGQGELDYKSGPRTEEPGAIEVPTPLDLAGVHNKYFAFLLREDAVAETRGTLQGASYRPIEELGRPEPRGLVELSIQLGLRLPEPGQSATWNYVVYAGPKLPGTFAEDYEPHGLVLVSDLSGSFCGLDFSAIGRVLLVILRFFHRFAGNWGVAIILLTVMRARSVFFPLNRRSQTAMARYQKKMKRVQPQARGEQAALRERFAEAARSPGEASCRRRARFLRWVAALPIFLQLPIFFGLFSALRTSFALRQAPFAGWITDLSRPDRLLRLDLDLPALPAGHVEYLNILPLLMVVDLDPPAARACRHPTDEQAARMQKMMMFMPVVFGAVPLQLRGRPLALHDDDVDDGHLRAEGDQEDVAHRRHGAGEEGEEEEVRLRAALWSHAAHGREAAGTGQAHAVDEGRSEAADGEEEEEEEEVGGGRAGFRSSEPSAPSTSRMDRSCGRCPAASSRGSFRAAVLSSSPPHVHHRRHLEPTGRSAPGRRAGLGTGGGRAGACHGGRFRGGCDDAAHRPLGALLRRTRSPAGDALLDAGAAVVHARGRGGVPSPGRGTAPRVCARTTLCAWGRAGRARRVHAACVSNGRLDLTRAEGVLALVEAGGEAERRAAAALLEGGLDERVGGLRDGLVELQALAVASLDFEGRDRTLHGPARAICPQRSAPGR